MDLLALQCLSRDSRDSGESREVVLAKKELHVSEERIKDLEEAMRSRAEVQALMEAEPQQMLRQGSYVIYTPESTNLLNCIHQKNCNP